MSSWDDYSYKVHKGLLGRDLIFGIPFVPFLVIGLLTLILVVLVTMWQIIPFSLIILYVMREITKNDQYLLDIFFDSLFQPNYLD
jgi:type IV secretory pathway VirB3-like protein